MKVKQVTPTEVVITGPRALAEWRESRAFFVPGYRHVPRFKSGSWDGKRWPGKYIQQDGDRYDIRCSLGLALRAANDLGFPPPVAGLDTTAWLAHAPRADELRDYQRESFLLATQHGWGRVALATNAGKGAVIALMARWARDSDRSVLILCDELAVYDALLGELKDWAGLGTKQLRQIKAGVKEPPELPGTSLAMVPTLARRLKGDDAKEWRAWIAEHEVVLLDEADKATSASWKAILKAASGSRWRVGFSGTFPTEPYAELIMDELMGPILTKVTNLDMVERGVSARPTVELHRFDVTDSLRHVPWPRKWSGSELRNLVYEYAIFENTWRHAFIASLIQPDTPTAIIIDRIEHGHALARYIPGSVFLDGSASAEKRLTELEGFQRGDTHILIVTKILDRGTNRLGHTADLIFAGAGSSERQQLQRIGRGLRRAGGKEFLRLVDVMDIVSEQNVKSHAGKSKAERVARYLEEGVRRRLETYNDEGFVVEIHATKGD